MRRAGERRWQGYAVLSRPLTILGVERRFFLLAATLAAAMWNAVGSLLAGGLIFAVLYGGGWVAWRRDPDMVAVVRAALRYRSRYDAGRLADRSPYVVIRRSAT